MDNIVAFFKTPCVMVSWCHGMQYQLTHRCLSSAGPAIVLGDPTFHANTVQLDVEHFQTYIETQHTRQSQNTHQIAPTREPGGTTGPSAPPSRS